MDSKMKINRGKWAVIASLLPLCAAAATSSATPEGKPFQALEDKIAQIDGRVTTLETLTTNGPIATNVDCNSDPALLNTTIAEIADLNVRVTLRVSGNCGPISINKDDLTILGLNGASIRANGSAVAVNINSGSTNVVLRDLEITGGTFAGLFVGQGAQVNSFNLNVHHTGVGVFGISSSSVEINDSDIHHNRTGVITSLSSQMVIRNSNLHENIIGASVFLNSSLWLGNSDIQGNTDNGLVVNPGGSAQFETGRVQNNTNAGIVVQANGTLVMGPPLSGSRVDINGNGSGVRLHDNAVAQVLNIPVNITGNSGEGLACRGNHKEVIYDYQHLITLSGNGDNSHDCNID